MLFLYECLMKQPPSPSSISPHFSHVQEHSWAEGTTGIAVSSQNPDLGCDLPSLRSLTFSSVAPSFFWFLLQVHKGSEYPGVSTAHPAPKEQLHCLQTLLMPREAVRLSLPL